MYKGFRVNSRDLRVARRRLPTEILRTFDKYRDLLGF